MATRTTSTFNASAAPPAAGSKDNVTPAFAVFAPVTLVPSLNFTPCFLKVRVACLTTSPSMPGKMLGRNSMTVTSAPKRRHTEPSSNPITPPPMTAMVLGGFDKFNAPVDDTICFSSTSTPGSGVVSDPVAMTMCLAV